MADSFPGTGSRPCPRGAAESPLTYLKDHGGQPVHVLEQQGFSVASLNTFCKHELGHFIYRPKKTYSLIREQENFVPRTLTGEQQTAYKRICAAIDSGSCKGQLLMGSPEAAKRKYICGPLNMRWNRAALS